MGWGDRFSTLEQPLNIMQLMIYPWGLRPYVEDWETVAVTLIQRLQQETQGEGPASSTARLLQDLKQELQPLPVPPSPTASGSLPVLPITFVKADQRLRFFTLISTLGTPRDITLQELRIESLFPADAATVAIMQQC